MLQRGSTWTRRGGETVAIDRMKLDELREARLELLQRDLGEPGTRALFDAVNDAIERYPVGGAAHADGWSQAA